MKRVYTCFTTSVVHEGHINIINEAKKYGEVIVGALSDEELIKYNKMPTLEINERVKLYRNLPGVSKVVIQNKMNYDDIISLLHPDYVVHGDNWIDGPLSTLRKHLIGLLNEYNGALIEIPYTNNEEVKKIDKQLHDKLSMPEYRRKSLKKLINIRPIIKFTEVHNGITGIIAEKTIVEKNGVLDQFDGMWISSYCESINRGKPDIEIVDMSSKIKTIDEVMDVTTKCLIVDGDSGANIEHLKYNIKTLERLGVSAIVIEDKSHENEIQESIEKFSEKIIAAKQAQITEDFLVFPKIESLVTQENIKKALDRAKEYIDSGADGIVIQTKKKSIKELYEFCDQFRLYDVEKPLIIMPTTYSDFDEKELVEHGINIIIYPNQLTRSSIQATMNTAKEILENHTNKKVESGLISEEDITKLLR